MDSGLRRRVKHYKYRAYTEEVLDPEAALRYIKRVRGMLPSPYAQKMLDELRKGDHD